MSNHVTLTIMKKILATIALIMTIVVSASAMTFSQARNEALYLSDKMAYELELSLEQYAAVYEINLDYLMSVTSQYDVYGAAWARRNSDLRYVLNVYQYELFIRTSYFYEPMEWTGSTWRYGIYTRYTDRTRFFFSYPSSYNSYRGGHNRVTDYYVNRHYNKPVGKPRSWRDNATTNVQNNWRNSTGYTSGHGTGYNGGHGNGYGNHGNSNRNGNMRNGYTNGSSNHGNVNYNSNNGNRNSGNSGGSSWRRNASTSGSNSQASPSGSRSNSSGTSGSGRFSGKRN